jgi:hypothetical protein
MTKQVKNFLEMIPAQRRPFHQSENGRVEVLLPRWGDGRVGRFLGTFLKSTPYRMRLDDVGTSVWLLCNGRRSVYEIGKCLQDNFGDSIEPVYDRLGLFLKQMKRSGIIEWK